MARLFAQNLLAAAAHWGSAALVQWYFAQYQMWHLSGCRQGLRYMPPSLLAGAAGLASFWVRF
jgi:hypothetical protein